MNMKWWHYLLCGLIIVIGVFTSIKLIDMFKVQSKEYGTVLSIETKQNFNIEAKYDLGFLDFEEKENGNFVYEVSEAPIKFNGANKEYGMLFNSEPVHDVKVSSGKIEGILTLNFYDTDGLLITTSDVKISIEFLASDTQIRFETKDINKSNSYLYRYLDINGAQLKIVTKGDV